MPGFPEDVEGKTVLVGFGRNAVLSVAGKVIESSRMDTSNASSSSADATEQNPDAATTLNSLKKHPATPSF